MRRLAALCALALLGGCPVAGMHRPVAVLALAAADTVLVAGDTLRLDATLGNPGADSITLTFGEGCAVHVFVQRVDGPVVDPPGGIAECPGPPLTLRLAPGDTVRYAHRWVAGEPGDYRAYAILEQHDLFRAGRRELKLGHRSGELRVRVRPAAPHASTTRDPGRP